MLRPPVLVGCVLVGLLLDKFGVCDVGDVEEDEDEDEDDEEEEEEKDEEDADIPLLLLLLLGLDDWVPEEEGLELLGRVCDGFLVAGLLKSL